MSVLRPLARLLAVGAVLSAAVAWSPAGDDPRRAPAPAPADTTRLAERAFAGGARTTLGARAALDEEALYREALAVVAAERDPVVRARVAALARELEIGGEAHAVAQAPDSIVRDAARSDAVVRRYLIELSRLALGGGAGGAPPTDGDLASFHREHAERFTTPARVRLAHVYLSAARRGAALEDDARVLLAELRERHVPASDAARHGDAFARGRLFVGSHAELARALGAAVADVARTARLGEWTGPVRSAWGLHLLRVEARSEAAPAPLETVRGRVAHALLRERRDERRRARLEMLRARYGTAAAALSIDTSSRPE